MSTTIELSKSFDEKIRDRVKEGIGDLLTDEDVKKIVLKIMNEVFAERGETKDGYGNIKKDGPMLLHTLVKDEMSSVIKEVLRTYLSEHSEILKEVIQLVLKRNVVSMISGVFNGLLQNEFNNLRSSIITTLTNGQRGY